jgi:hypothetical protein
MFVAMRGGVAISLLLVLSAFGVAGAQLLSVDLTGTNAGGVSLNEQFCIAPNGRLAAFSSSGSNYVSGDVNGISDVFVYDCSSRSYLWDTTASRASLSGNVGSVPVAFTPDGRFLLFASRATNLVSSVSFAAGESYQLYVRDLVSNVTTAATVSTNGTNFANGSVIYNGAVPTLKRISSDGRYVSFLSTAADLVSQPDNNNGYDVFCRDVVSGATELITVTPDGTHAIDRTVNTFFVSTNARYFAFATAATNVVPGLPNTNSSEQVYWRDRVAGTNALVSVSFDGRMLNNAGLRGMSSDGRFVCFDTSATNVLVDLTDTNGTRDFFIRDMLAGETWLVTRNTNGVTTGSRSSGGKFSDNGEWFTFGNSAGDLVPGVTNAASFGGNVYAHHLPSRTNAIISVSYDGHTGSVYGVGEGFSRISATGRYVVFSASGTEFVPGTPDKASRLYVRDTRHGYTRRVLHYRPLVTPAFNEARFQLSDDERWIFFLAQANYDPSVNKTNTAIELFRAPLFAPSFTTRTGSSFAMDGLADETYWLQFSPDLANWTIIATNTAAADGTVNWNIPAEASSLNRFYRVIWR